MIPHQK